MAEGPRAPLLRTVSDIPMGATIPPESKSRLTADPHEPDAHEAVTVAPPAPFEDLLRHLTSTLSNGEQPFRAAIEAGTRAGSSLSELSKIISELSSGLMGATQANENLVQELSTLRALLGSANAQQLSLEQRLAQLEQELLQSQRLAEKERQFLTEQHDDFVAALLEEHEEALVARGRPENSRAPSFHPPRALQLDTDELDSTLPARSSSPRLPSVIPRLIPPPADFGPSPSGWTPLPPAPELSAVAPPAVVSAANMPQSPAGPALKQKPDPSTRPLTDYSLGGDGLPSEMLEGARLTTSKPPQK